MAGEKPITAMILAGGKGTRLQSAVSDRPKVLAEIHGRPFLSFLLDQLRANQIQRVILCTGYMADAVEAAFGNSYKGMSIAYSRENQPLGTGGALRLAADVAESDHVLILNGDSFCGFDLEEFSGLHQLCKARASILLAEVADTSRFGQVRMDDGGRVLGFEEKGGASGRGWINAGIYLMSLALARSIPTGRMVSLEREIFPGWIGQGLFAMPAAGPFIDIGTPESYRAAEAFFAGF